MRGIFSILVAMLLALLIMIGSLFTTIDQPNTGEDNNTPSKYHIQVVIPNTDEHFWTLFQEGAKDASFSLGVFVEFVPIMPRNVNDLVGTIEKSIYSEVDGIAFQPADNEKTMEAVEKAIKQGIAIVNYENDKFLLPEVAAVGSNSYEIGYTAGSMIPSAIGTGDANVVVILEEGDSQGDSQYRNMKIQGIIDAISSYDSIKLSEVYTLESGMFEAERLTNTIVSSGNNVNVIVCIDEKSTPAVAQVLVDNNMVGNIKVIGYGTMSQTLDYIKRRVIYGTVSPDAYTIGHQTVEELYARIRGNAISDAKDTELFIIDQSNVDKYIIENQEYANED